MKYAVYTGTTDGPVRIERFHPENAPLSEVFVGRGVTPLGYLSSCFDNFMQPARPPELAFGPFPSTGFRMDISAAIESGESWQLAVFVACGLAKTGQLAAPGEAADVCLWLTGRIDADLTVGSVGYLERKIFQSEGFFKRGDQNVRIFIPAGNLADVAHNDLAIVPVENAMEVFDLLEHPLDQPEISSRTGVVSAWVMKAVSVCLVAVIALVIYRNFLPETEPSDEDAVMAMEDVAKLAPSLNVTVLRPPTGETCAAVHFGTIKPVHETVVVRDNEARLAASRDICGLSFVIKAAQRGGDVSTFVDFRGVQAAEIIGQPGEPSVPVNFADRHEWSVMLPAQQTRNFSVAVFAAAADRTGTAVRRLSVTVTP